MTGRRDLDPTGKRALFETPVIAAPDTLRAGEPRHGRHALFSTGPPRAGTAIVECSRCGDRTRVTLADLGLRLAALSLYLPLLHPRHPHRLRCPACRRRTWCRIGWRQ